MEIETTFDDLKHDIQLDIFKRLDCKTVGKSRCVSKEWLSTLMSNYFNMKHMKHQPIVEKPFFLYSTLRTCTSYTMRMIDDVTAHSLELSYPQRGSTEYPRFIGSCNGLTLFTTQRLGFEGVATVVNLTTKEKAEVDFSFFHTTNPRFWRLYVHIFGFGFDIINEDYHIIVFSNHEMNGEYSGTSVDVMLAYDYSFKNRSWRSIENFVPDETLVYYSSGACYDNALFGLVSSNDTCSMMSFEFGTNFVRRYSLPGESDQLFVSRGSLFTTCNIADTGIEVWIMTDCEVDASWSKAFTINFPYNLFVRKPVLSLSSNENIVLDMGAGEIQVYNLSNETFTEFTVLNQENGYGGFSYEGVYFETLVCPILI